MDERLHELAREIFDASQEDARDIAHRAPSFPASLEELEKLEELEELEELEGASASQCKPASGSRP
jgi:hypothetical protein